MKTMGFCLWSVLVALGLTGLRCHAQQRNESESVQRPHSMYNLRKQQFPLDQDQRPNRRTQLVTNSDDSDPKVLSPFLLEIAETQGELSDSAIEVVQAALNKFLIAELRAVYDNEYNEVDLVSSRILTHVPIESTGEPGRRARHLQETGTQLEAQVTVQFDSEPSPQDEEVETIMESVMTDLTFFISNIAYFQHEELKDVYTARRVEYPTPSPTAAPTPSPQPVTPVVEPPPAPTDESRGQVDTNGGSLSTIVPSVLAGAAVMSLAAFFLLKRRRKTEDDESKQIFVVGGVDEYSIDDSLESAPVIHLPASMHYDSGTEASMSLSEPSHSTGMESEPSLASTSDYHTGAGAGAGIIRTPKNGQVLHPMQHMPGVLGSPIQWGTRHNDPADNSITSSEYNDADEGHAASFGPIEDAEGAEAVYSPNSTEGASADVFVSINDVSSVHAIGGSRDWVRIKSTDMQREHRQQQQQQQQQENPERKEQNNMGSFMLSPKQSPIPAGSNTSNNFSGFSFHMDTTLDNIEEEVSQRSSDVSKSIEEDTAAATRQGGEDANASVPAGGSPTANPMEVITLGQSAKVRPTSTGTANPLQRIPTPAQSLNSGPPNIVTSPSSADDDSNYMEGRSSGRPAIVIDHDNEPSSAAQMSARATSMIGSFLADQSDSSQQVSPQVSRPMPAASPADGQPLKGGLKGGRFNQTLIDRYGNNALPCLSPEPNIADFLDVTTGNDSSVEEASHPLAEAIGIDRGGTLSSGQARYSPSSSLNSDFDASDAYRSRRHAGNTAGADGSAMYQTNAMQPLDWSVRSDCSSMDDSTISGTVGTDAPSRQFRFGDIATVPHLDRQTQERDASSPYDTNQSRTSSMPQGKGVGIHSAVEAAAISSPSDRSKPSIGSSQSHESEDGQASTSKQLINDLVWLEKKIADVRQSSSYGDADHQSRYDASSQQLEAADSLSYVSGDEVLSPSSATTSGDQKTAGSIPDSRMSSIACRDCFAPPGKLHIVIHSTKDGPAVHTVKDGSSLFGHVFPGDLIIAVDNVDTRSFTAEQVMTLMATNSGTKRKITVLHFEDE